MILTDYEAGEENSMRFLPIKWNIMKLENINVGYTSEGTVRPNVDIIDI